MGGRSLLVPVLTALGLLSAACASCPRAEPAVAPDGGSGGPQALDPAVPSSEPTAGMLSVVVDADGRAFASDRPLYKSEDFAAAVQHARAAGPVDGARISADARVSHGRVVAIADELKRAGVTRIAFAVAAGGAPVAEPAPGAPASTAPSVAPAPTAPAPASSDPPAAPGNAESLPEVRVQNVGLHIGGGPNDDATKQPFASAIEKHFDAFRACYVKVEDPRKGGTFGVDLKIGRAGGRAQVQQPRTGMKGQQFRQCVTRVFEAVEFEKPKRGPTMISYSLEFSLAK